MSNEKAHLAKAEKNEQFFEDVLELHSDWAVVGLFYSAVHYVEAYLSKRLNVHSDNHEDRKSHINSIPDLKGIYKIYSELQNISYGIRYTSFNPNRDKALEYKRELYDPIKDHMEKLLKK